MTSRLASPKVPLLIGSLALGLSALAGERPAPPFSSPGQGFIRAAKDGRHFEFSASGKRFAPWGVNYDHDRNNRLLETYWVDEWKTVAEDFAEMKALGANTARVHPQISRFMKSPREPNAASFELL